MVMRFIRCFMQYRVMHSIWYALEAAWRIEVRKLPF